MLKNQEKINTVDSAIETLKSYQLLRGEIMVLQPTEEEMNSHYKTSTSGLLLSGKPEAGTVDEMLLTVVAVGNKVEDVKAGDKAFVRGTLTSIRIGGHLLGVTHENNIIAKLK